jgi:phosphate transport system ATP-binding protein
MQPMGITPPEPKFGAPRDGAADSLISEPPPPMPPAPAEVTWPALTTAVEPWEGAPPPAGQPQSLVPSLSAPTSGGPLSLLRQASNPATLEAVALSAWFGKRKVLERCSLLMEAQKVTALIGPSGCGKSTFLRILNRMHEVVPSAQIAGRVELDGVDIYGGTLSATAVRTHIGMVFQKPNPFPAMTIGQNVLAGLKLSGTKTSDPDQLIEECLARAGLWNEVKDRLNEGGMALSGGQQQRLCIARALAVRPQVLLMDEPCSALDPISTRVVEETITELAGDITIVIVTHNMQQAARVSTKCAFFLVEELGQPGRIVEAGDTKMMFEAPSDPRTLDYVTGRFG